MDDRFGLVVIGMGSGGMVAARAAASFGVRTAVVERARPGGDCLWTGCVPSKALLATARAAQAMRSAGRVGVEAVEPRVEPARAWERLRAVRERIAATDDHPDRFRDEGIEVVTGHGRLTSPTTVDVDGRTLHAKRILLATGGRPAIPAIPGLENAGFLTSETVFELERPPSSVTILGGGMAGIELAQAFARLGIETSVVQRDARVLPRDEPDLVDLLVDRLEHEGVRISTGVDVERVVEELGAKVVVGVQRGDRRRWASEELVVATGRRPNVEHLGLEAVRVRRTDAGVWVDDAMRTNVRGVYACGEVTGRHHFTHAAAFEAARAVRNMFLPGKDRSPYEVPWCAFTDPELAHAGLTEAEAREAFGDRFVRVYRRDLAHNDRARTDAVETGAVIAVTAKGRLVGAHVLAPAAGELINELALAISRKMKLADVASTVHVYPTIATAVHELAAEAAFERAARYRRFVRA